MFNGNEWYIHPSMLLSRDHAASDSCDHFINDKVTRFCAPGLVTLIIPRHARPGIESAVSAEWTCPNIAEPEPEHWTRSPRSTDENCSGQQNLGDWSGAGVLVMAHPHLTLTLIIITEVYLFL